MCAGHWSNLTSGGDTNGAIDGNVNAMQMYNSMLVIGGSFSKVGNYISAGGVAVWDGTSFSALTDGTNHGVGGSVFAACVFGSNLVVGGSFRTLSNGVTSANGVAVWTGTEWKTFSSSQTLDGTTFFVVDGVDGTVNALASFNNQLYAGGEFQFLDGSSGGLAGLFSAQYLAKWDGNNWTPIDELTPPLGPNGFVNALAIFDARLIIGGMFDVLTDGTAALNLASWNGTTLRAVPNNVSCGAGIGQNDGFVSSLAVFQSKLIIGGRIPTLCDGSPAGNIVAWDGVSFSTLGNGVDGTVRALSSSATQLIVGGNYHTAGTSIPATSVSVWDGSAWVAPSCIATGVQSDGRVTAAAHFLSRIYVGGDFHTLDDGSSANAVVSVQML